MVSSQRCALAGTGEGVLIHTAHGLPGLTFKLNPKQKTDNSRHVIYDGEKKGMAKGLQTVVGERFVPEALEGWMLFDFNLSNFVCEMLGSFCHFFHSLTYP